MEPSKTFVMVIDEDREKVLNIMEVVCELVPGFKLSLSHYGLTEVYEKMFDENNDKAHDLGMCPDPNCERKQV